MHQEAAKQFLSDEGVRLRVLWDEGDGIRVDFEVLDIDKDWDALKLAVEMRGKNRDSNSPLNYLFEGGTETEVECTYGYIRLLGRHVVQQLAESLGSLSEDSVRERLVVANVLNEDVYSEGLEWTQESLDLVWFTFQETKDFFYRASACNDVVLAGLW